MINVKLMRNRTDSFWATLIFNIFPCVGLCLQMLVDIQAVQHKKCKSQQHQWSTPTKTAGLMISCCCSYPDPPAFSLYLFLTVEILQKCESSLVIAVKATKSILNKPSSDLFRYHHRASIKLQVWVPHFYIRNWDLIVCITELRSTNTVKLFV